MELYRKHRPKTLAELVGQPQVVKILESKLKEGFPHAILLTGGSGCGKTTVARILRRALGCGKDDYIEIDAATNRGIDTVRDMRNQVKLAPMGGKCRIWCWDEVHMGTSEAQNAMLKILEDAPDHVYFFLATTNPGKLLRTIVTRCMEIKLTPLNPKDMADLIRSVCEKEKAKLTNDVVERIAEASEGSARKALVILDSVIRLEGEEEQLDCISKNESRKVAFDLAKALLWSRATWPDVAKILKGIEDEDPEGIRHLILKCASGEMLKGGKNAEHAARVLEEFRDNYFDSKRAGLILSCWNVLGR